jgi:hypothetical protein
MGRDKRDNGDYQRAVGEFVGREVIYCVSGLVSEIGKEKLDEWHHLFAQDDWETPASDAIRAMPRQLLEKVLEQNGFAINAEDTPHTLAAAYLQHLRDEKSVRDFCDEHNLEPHQIEIYEHWIVSEYLSKTWTWWVLPRPKRLSTKRGT